jgi:hypothetical protein
MSQEDKETPASAEGEDSETAPAPAPAPAAAPLPVPSQLLFQPAPRPRPILGPSLSVFGVLLWAYVVFGQYTTSWFQGSAPMGEGAAFFFVFVATAVAWAFAVRRSLVVPVAGQYGLAGRAMSIGFLALAWCFITVVLAAVFGQASGKNIDWLITMVLVVVSVIAEIQGRRVTLPTRPPRTQRERMVAALLWAGAGAMTLAACAELAGTS